MASKSAIEWPKLLFTSILFFLSRCVIVIHSQSSSDGNYASADDRVLCEYLLDPLVEGEFSQQCNVLRKAEWKYTTNVSAETKADYSDAYKNFLEFSSLIQIEALSKFNGVYGKFGTRKAAQILKTMGPNNMSLTNYNRMRDIENKMQNDYDATTVCRLGTSCVDMNLNEIQQVMKDSSTISEREYYYKAWNEELSKKITVNDYAELIRLQNEYARSNGFPSMSHMLLEPYNDGSVNWTAKSFLDEMETVWESIKPNFEATRKFATDRLRSIPEYANRIDLDNNIHINLLNDLWGEDWSILAERTKPFPLSSTLDIIATDEMLRIQKDANKMFIDANRMMTKIGLEDLLQIKYGWGESIINKTQVAPDEEIICIPQSMDFCEDPFSYRVRMCTEVNLKDLVTIHEELGKVEYFFAYKDLPYVFRSGVNPAVPLGLAKALGLAAQSPKYLNCHLQFFLGENLKFCDLSIPTTPSPTTEEPETTTVESETTTLESETTTLEPETTTVEPETTTEEPETTTVELETTTEDTSESPPPFSIDELDSFDFNSEDAQIDKEKRVEEKNERNLVRTFRTNIQNEEANYLYKLQLQEYFYAPYALAIEKWRWEVYNGLPSADYNKRWWELRKEYQGLIPPELPTIGLHAASKFDIINYKSYMDEFVSHIVQFQIFENLCVLAGEYDKNNAEKKFLHRCVISDASISMGDIIYDIMEKGAEVPWPDAIKNLTGSETILPGPIEDYFGPVKEAIGEINRPGKGTAIAIIIAGVILAGALAACCIGVLIGRRSTKKKDREQNGEPVELTGFDRSR